MDTIHSLLASTGGDLDHPAIACRVHRNRYLGYSRLIIGSGVIFLGSHRLAGLHQPFHQLNAHIVGPAGVQAAKLKGE
jgi:hypothetical protein